MSGRKHGWFVVKAFPATPCPRSRWCSEQASWKPCILASFTKHASSVVEMQYR
uniref:Uncharacterized protein n=1 Tax=Arundo donax TaxID=35708 RepID=A0A0A9FZW5_ARUDO